jgi:hypothetical protein
MAERQWAS